MAAILHSQPSIVLHRLMPSLDRLYIFLCIYFIITENFYNRNKEKKENRIREAVQGPLCIFIVQTLRIIIIISRALTLDSFMCKSRVRIVWFGESLLMNESGPHNDVNDNT